jgi:hypothetical protein
MSVTMRSIPFRPSVLRERVVPSAGLRHAVAGALEHERHDRARFLFVIDQQHSRSSDPLRVTL